MKPFRLAIHKGKMAILLPGAEWWQSVESWEAIKALLDAGETVDVNVEGVTP